MNLILELPAVLRVAMAFSLVVFLIRKKLSLGNAFMTGALVMGALFALKPILILRSVFSSLSDLNTVALAVIVSLILVLSNSMEMAGQMARMLQNFQGMVKHPKWKLIIFPALIGLLPMPGGAVFSAPMVEKMGHDSQYGRPQLSFINYWFRHIWEYWWPLYPGVLLATLLAQLNLARFILVMLPLTLIALSTGFMLLKNETALPANQSRRPAWGPFFLELLPFFIVIVPGIGMGLGISSLFPRITTGKEIGLILSLLVAIGWVWRKNRIPKTEIGKLLVSTKLLQMIYMIFGILVFKGILEDCQAVDLISGELMVIGVPLTLIVVLLPFLVGMVTGITIAFVGSTFPILIPLIHALEPGAGLLPFMMLAITAGFCGVMLSPVHLCFILSNQYFEAGMPSVYRQLWVPCAFLVAGGLSYFYVLRGFGI